MCQQAEIISPGERLRGAFRVANREVRNHQRLHPKVGEMCTTLVTLTLPGDGTATIAHCGDSRCYLLRKQTLTLLTADHAVGRRGTLVRAIGLEESEFATIKLLSTHPNDVFLLCSDGLTNAIKEPQIAYRLKKRRAAEAICRDLIQDALDAGGPDNVTAIVVKT